MDIEGLLKFFAVVIVAGVTIVKSLKALKGVKVEKIAMGLEGAKDDIRRNSHEIEKLKSKTAALEKTAVEIAKMNETLKGIAKNQTSLEQDQKELIKQVGSLQRTSDKRRQDHEDIAEMGKDQKYIRGKLDGLDKVLTEFQETSRKIKERNLS
jgi:hypothetical protein